MSGRAQSFSPAAESAPQKVRKTAHVPCPCRSLLSSYDFRAHSDHRDQLRETCGLNDVYQAQVSEKKKSKKMSGD